MPEEPTQSPSEPEPSAPPGTPPSIEALQELKAQEGNQAATDHALRLLLGVLDPHPQDARLTARQVLERLENVIARELQAQKE